MAIYNVTMQLTVTAQIDTDNYDWFEVEEGQKDNPNDDPREVHKFLQRDNNWNDAFGFYNVEGSCELNELSVKKP